RRERILRPVPARLAATSPPRWREILSSERPVVTDVGSTLSPFVEHGERVPLQGTARTKETLVKYVLLIMDTPAEPAPNAPEYGAWYAEVGAWYEKWGATGKLAAGHQLQGADTAKTVRAAGVTDGPYIETKEVLGGYSVIDADSMDEAVEI